MKAILSVVVAVGALVVGAADAYAIAWGGGARSSTSASLQVDSTTGPTTSVPEPSTLYAIGSGLALLGGAGWYIRRRK